MVCGIADSPRSGACFVTAITAKGQRFCEAALKVRAVTEVFEAFEGGIPAARRALETEFRTILGVEQDTEGRGWGVEGGREGLRSEKSSWKLSRLSRRALWARSCHQFTSRRDYFSQPRRLWVFVKGRNRAAM
jgi:hypothetical protein